MVFKKWWAYHLVLLTANVIFLFLAAGTFKWCEAWLYILISLCFVVGSRLTLHPNLLVIRSMFKDGTIKWDQLLAPITNIVGPLAISFIAGLDHRFAWSAVDLKVKGIALATILLGTLFTLWAMHSNHYYSQTVRFQYERFPVVISNGPYKFVRHPGYTGHILSSLATPIILGSWVALIPSGFIVCVYLVRTALEDVTFQRHFKGYYDYTKKVTYRLFPRIW